LQIRATLFRPAGVARLLVGRNASEEKPMNFNPKIGVYVSVVAVVVSVIAIMSPGAFPSYVPAGGAAAIISTCAFLNILFNAVNGVLHLYSSSQPGPLAPPDPPAVKAAMAAAARTASALLFGLLFVGALALSYPTTAHAGTLEEPKIGSGRAGPPSAPLPPIEPKIGPVQPAPEATVSAGDSGNPLNAIGEWAEKDMANAIVASTKYPDVQDQVGKACLTQIQTLANMIHDHPLPATFMLATDIEYGRLVQSELNHVCANPSCAQVWQDAQNAAKALEVIPLPISFATICGKVPVVGLTLPTATPTLVASSIANPGPPSIANPGR
jgi:hypothetical protein